MSATGTATNGTAPTRGLKGVVVADTALGDVRGLEGFYHYRQYAAPDLAAAAEALGITPEALIEQHLAGDYRVYMYGFAPGYAYLGGVPEAIHLPRKPAAVRGYPVGSVMIAGAQCLITTLPMPTGWWVIGRTAVRVLDADAERPFLFDPGDRVRFTRVHGDMFG